jgi:hypothetical protein
MVLDTRSVSDFSTSTMLAIGVQPGYLFPLGYPASLPYSTQSHALLLAFKSVAF